jgi:AraC family transcriptional regulator
MSDVPSALAYGVHLGTNEIRRELPGFSLSLLQPKFREEDVPLHTHESASLVFVLNGVYRTSADGPAKILRGETLLFNPAGTTHRDSFVEPRGQFLAISISDEIARLLDSERLLPRAAIQMTTHALRAVARRLAKRVQIGERSMTPVMEDACWEILAAFCETDRPAQRPRKSFPSWLLEARAILQEPDGDLPITKLAAQVGVHPVHLARCFRKQMNCSPAEYRLRCRLQRAMEQIRGSESSILQISLDNGFFDQSHFTHAFRNHFGHAPGVYRGKLRYARQR